MQICSDISWGTWDIEIMALCCHIQYVDVVLDHEDRHMLYHNEDTYDSLF